MGFQVWLPSVRARILIGFVTLLLLQGGVALSVWMSENRLEASDAASARVQEAAARNTAVSAALQDATLKLEAALRTGSKADRDAVGQALSAFADRSGAAGDPSSAGGQAGPVGDVGAALGGAMEGMQTSKARAEALLQAASEVENAQAALASAAARQGGGAAERVLPAMTAVSQALAPAVRYALGQNERDFAQLAGAVVEAKRSVQALGGSEAEMPARVRRLAVLVNQGLDGLIPAGERLTEALRDRDTALGRARDAVAVARAGFEARAAGIAGEARRVQAEASAAKQRVRDTLVVAGASAILLGLGLATIVGLSITRPVARLEAAMRALADREGDVAVPGLNRRDEIGRMAAAVQVFKDGLERADALAADQERLKAESQALHRAALHRTADAVDATVGQMAHSLSASSSALEQTAQSMSATAADTTDQARQVSAAAEEASAGVQTVAAAAEQLSASIGEIGRHVSHCAAMTEHAVEAVRRTDQVVSALSERAGRIGTVVEIISRIARQTNLLALNATIEAARAGEAGRGFAVVAGEVKTLAQQTSSATGEIESQVVAIQSSTRDAVAAIREITQSIETVGGIATSIASAVQEQGAATAEISRNVQRTAVSTREVTANIGGVGQAANDTGIAATQVLSEAGGLARQADELKREVSSLMASVRVARSPG